MFSQSSNLSKNVLDFKLENFIFENDLKSIIPESFLAIACFVILLYAVPLLVSEKNNYPILTLNSCYLFLVSILFTIVLLFHNSISKAKIFYNTFQSDQLSLLLKVLVLVACFLCLAISLQYIEQESVNTFELVLLTLLSSISMLFLISAGDFIAMYLAVELQSLCFYVLAGIKRNSEFSTEAGLKYFLLGAFSSGILLLGCGLQYGFTGTSNFSELCQIYQCTHVESLSSTYGGIGDLQNQAALIGQEQQLEVSSSRACELGMIFILVGLLFKLTAVPFHMWAPDVYQGSLTCVTAFFAIVPKISVLAVLTRLCYQGFYDFMSNWQKMLILSCIASMVLGALAALSQNKIKRLLAWSSISHVGYLLLGICCGTVEGIQALIIYLFIYLAMTISLFAIVLSSLHRVQLDAQTTIQPLALETSNNISANKNDKQQILNQTPIERLKYNTDLAFCALINPVLAITISVTMFSIAGIPPLAGFYSKAFLMFAAMSAAQYLLAIVAILTSVLSCFYYIRIVKIMYFEKPTSWLTFMQINRETSIVLGLTFAFLLFFCLKPQPLFLVSHKMALILCF